MVIAPADWADWLDPANNEKEHLLATMHPAIARASAASPPPGVDRSQLRPEQRPGAQIPLAGVERSPEAG